MPCSRANCGLPTPRVLCFIRMPKLKFIERKASSRRIDTASDRFTCRYLVNAAGAWADDIARSAGVNPCEIIPKRRTVACFDPGPIKGFQQRPLVRNAQESMYFKPLSGNILLTPADETLCLPGDCWPEYIAIALERLKQETLLPPSTIKRKWAVLRCFTGDESPVIGFASDAPEFFWVAALAYRPRQPQVLQRLQ